MSVHPTPPAFRSWRHHVRPFLLFALVAGLLVTVVAACGGDDDGGTSGDESRDIAEAAFPATVKHKYGTTTVPKAPQRVVSVGYRDQDLILAFGYKPLGVRTWFGPYEDQIWPWARERIGGQSPKVVAAREIDMEAVAALQPDLIMGISSNMSKEEYDLLSRIAPTIPQSGDYPDWQMPWHAEIRMAGQALGQPNRAEEFIKGIEDRFAQVQKEHPEFIGKTASVSFYFNGQPGAYASGDSRSELLMEMGFKIPAEYDQIAAGAFYFNISAERMTVLDQDVIVWITSDPAIVAELKALPLRPQMRAYREGREVFLDQELAAAFSFASPLSIPYLLDALVPKLAAAVDGNPATAVP